MIPWKTWVIVGLTAVISLFYHNYKINSLKNTNSQLSVALSSSKASLRAKSDELEATEKALLKRHSEALDAVRKYQTLQKELDTIKRKEDETKDYLNSPIPSSVRNLLMDATDTNDS